MIKKSLITLLFTVLAGCAMTTQYQPFSAMSSMGYTEVQLDSTRYIITFTSPRPDKQTAVIQGALKRAAEITIQNGFDFFVILSDSANESSSSFTAGGAYTATRVGNQTFGTFSGGIPIVVQKSQQQITIQMVKGMSIPNALNARETLLINSKAFTGN